MLELRLLLVGLFDRLGALLLRLRGFRGRAVRGVALRWGFRVCVCRARYAAAERLGVCAGPALRPQSYAAVSVSVWPRRLLGRQRRWRRCGAALRRCAAAGEGPRRRRGRGFVEQRNVVYTAVSDAAGEPTLPPGCRVLLEHCLSVVRLLRGRARRVLDLWSKTKLAN